MKRTNRTRLVRTLVAIVIALCCASGARAELPEARQSPYSVVYYCLTDDEAQARRQLETIRDLGATQVLALIYWWQAETLGGDYWKEQGYRPNQIGEGAYKAIDHFVNISRELGLRPSLRLGSFKEMKGLWHPMDKSGSIEPYAAWVAKIAERYRGKVDHYMIGDEENQAHADLNWNGTPQEYMQKMLIPLATAVKKGDPSAKVSTCGASSSPATEWTLKLIELGLPKYADGVGSNLWHTQVVEGRANLDDFMRRVRKAWPDVKFYGNGIGYVINRGPQDARQAAAVAQTMFTLWDLGWDDAPYYVYHYSITADTKENYGLAQLPTATEPGQFSDGWRAYQTIAHVFYDRDKVKAPSFKISLKQSRKLTAADGSNITIAPPNPELRSYVRDDKELIVYLAYPSPSYPVEGKWDVVIESNEWGDAKQVPLLDHTKRIEMAARRDGASLVIPSVKVGPMPTILLLSPAK